MFRLAATRANAFKCVSQIQCRGLACTAIYIRGLSPATTSAQLREVGEKYGKVHEVNIIAPKPPYQHATGFVKLYVGEIPSTIEELAKLQYPSQDEIDAVGEIGENMVRETDGMVLDECKLTVQESNKNSPNNIQYRAFNQLQRDSNRYNTEA
ncbi:hypothetical protein IWW50_004288 [Coemansia erecta]|nr:hypothetical protein IWW50_004288 [Coemansia erecta]